MRLFGLTLGGRLDRYVAKLFIGSYAVAFFLVVGLAVIFDMTSHLSWFDPWENGRGPPAGTVPAYYLLNTPFVYLQVAPYVTLVAGLFTLSRLLRNNEVTAALAAGISAHRVLVPILCGSALVAAGMFALREFATDGIGTQRDRLRDMLEYERRNPMYENVWVRDRAGNVARLEKFMPSMGRDLQPEIVGLQATLRAGDRTWRKISADRAVWTRRGEGNGWRLEGGVMEEVEGVQRSWAVEWLDGIEFLPRDARARVKASSEPLDLSFSEVRELVRRDPQNQKYQTLLQYHLTFPLANLVLLLCALPFLLGRERGKQVEGLVAGFLLCMFYFAVEFMTRELGLEGELSPLLSGWLPVLGFGALGLALFDSMRS